ncbi:3189_t:CDS:1, partial [Acaulospora colombiana]
PTVSNVTQEFILNLSTSLRIQEMFLKLPTEVLEAIILECAVINPSLLACLAQTCRALRALISHPTDQHIWRTIFLSIFDDPRCILSLDRGISQELVSFDWQRETQRRCRAELRMDRAAVTEMEDFDEVVDEDVADTLFDVAMSTLPATSDATSLNAEWLAE